MGWKGMGWQVSSPLLLSCFPLFSFQYFTCYTNADWVAAGQVQELKMGLSLER